MKQKSTKKIVRDEKTANKRIQTIEGKLKKTVLKTKSKIYNYQRINRLKNENRKITKRS